MNNIMVWGGFFVGISMFCLSVFLWFRFRIKNVYKDLLYFGSKKRWKTISSVRKTAKLTREIQAGSVGAAETTKLKERGGTQEEEQSQELQIIEDITLVYQDKNNF